MSKLAFQTYKVQVFVRDQLLKILTSAAKGFRTKNAFLRRIQDKVANVDKFLKFSKIGSYVK